MSTTPTIKTRKPSRRVVAILTAAALIAGAAIAVGATRAYGAETARQCSAALTRGEAATGIARQANKDADAALEAITSTILPGGQGWKSTSYAKRPAVRAVAKTEARPSAIDFIKVVGNDKLDLARLKAVTACGDRATAEKIANTASDTRRAASQLTLDTSALTIDFATFQKDETTRVAAEVAAAKKKAAAEAAAKKAAEEAAAKAAAEAEASRVVAAAQQAAAAKTYSSGSTSISTSTGSTYTPPAPTSGSSVPGQGPLGGSVGQPVPGGDVWCLKSNGEGGTTTYRCK